MNASYSHRHFGSSFPLGDLTERAPRVPERLPKNPFSIFNPILVLFYYLYIVLHIGYALDQLRLIGYRWYNLPEILFEDSGTVPDGQ